MCVCMCVCACVCVCVCVLTTLTILCSSVGLLWHKMLTTGLNKVCTMC